MRITEAMLSIPQLFLLIVLGKLLGSKPPNVWFFWRSISGSVIVVFLVIGLTSWMYVARIIRAIMFRHLIPNTQATSLMQRSPPDLVLVNDWPDGQLAPGHLCKPHIHCCA